MLQTYGPYRTVHRVSNRWRIRGCLAFRSFVVVHRTRHISSATYLGLYEGHAGSSEEEGRGRRCTDGEVERAVGADGYEAWDRSAGKVSCSARVELLDAC
jgi:hypothetical protein